MREFMYPPPLRFLNDPDHAQLVRDLARASLRTKLGECERLKKKKQEISRAKLIDLELTYRYHTLVFGTPELRPEDFPGIKSIECVARELRDAVDA